MTDWPYGQAMLKSEVSAKLHLIGARHHDQYLADQPCFTHYCAGSGRARAAQSPSIQVVPDPLVAEPIATGLRYGMRKKPSEMPGINECFNAHVYVR